jgi:hypothetical protein
MNKGPIVGGVVLLFVLAGVSYYSFNPDNSCYYDGAFTLDPYQETWVSEVVNWTCDGNVDCYIMNKGVYLNEQTNLTYETVGDLSCTSFDDAARMCHYKQFQAVCER